MFEHVAFTTPNPYGFGEVIESSQTLVGMGNGKAEAPFALWLFVVLMEVVFDHGEHLQYRWPFAVALLMKHCVY